MKAKIILSLLVMLLSITASYASFPVKRVAKAQNTEVTVDADASEAYVLESPAATAAGDDFWISLLLWFFLGWAAGHRWYLGSPIGWNILFILTLGGLGIWWLVDGIQIITGTY